MFPVSINWKLISDSLEYYKTKGYKYIEVPWIVSDEAVKKTFLGNSVKSRHGEVVGSAEQSFIQLMLEGKLQYGKYVAASPCFRDELVYDDIHFPYFFKVELISINPQSSKSDMYECIDHAQEFFALNCDKRDIVILVKTEDGIDLNLNSIEIGSYGIRNSQGFEWVYGTGLAEPRFSQAIIGTKK